jgi:hypothetical protein
MKHFFIENYMLKNSYGSMTTSFKNLRKIFE